MYTGSRARASVVAKKDIIIISLGILFKIKDGGP